MDRSNIMLLMFLVTAAAFYNLGLWSGSAVEQADGEHYKRMTNILQGTIKSQEETIDLLERRCP